MHHLKQRLLFAAFLMALLNMTFALAQSTDPKNLFLIRVDGKAGFIDRNGKVIIKPQFDNAHSFSSGLAPVKVKGKWGFIDETGQVVVEPKFDWLYWAGLSEGIVPAGIDGKIGGIDRTGKFVIEPKYEMANKFSDGLMPVRLPKGTDYFEKWIYVDATGQKAIEKEFYSANSFVDGRAFVKVGFDEWALIDKSGNEVTKKHFDSNDPFDIFSERLTAVRIKDKWGYIDRNGNFVIKPRFDDANNFSEGLAAVQIGCNWGFIDISGKLVIPPKFSSAGKFSDGLAAVSMENENTPKLLAKTKEGTRQICGLGFGHSGPFGYIDKSGNMVIPPRFGRAFVFSDGIAQVSFGEPPDVVGYIGKRGYIDKTGSYIWEPTK